MAKKLLLNRPTVDRWLELAASDDPERPALAKPFGQWASNGFVAHVDTRRPFVDPAKVAPDIFPILNPARKYKRATITISRYQLMLALRRMYIFASAGSDRCELRCNGRLEYSARAESLGETSGYIEYQHEGEDIVAWVNPRYLYNAILGMDDTVSIAFGDKDYYPLYITDGTLEAVVMPMRKD